MSNLSAFLAENALQVENVKYVASKRFLGEDGNPVEWEICCILPSEDEEIRKKATRHIPVPNRRNQFTQDLDISLYLGRLAARCTVYPDLANAELQNSYRVMGADELLKTMLTPGEYADYLNAVQVANGFEVAMEEDIDEAKNSSTGVMERQT